MGQQTLLPIKFVSLRMSYIRLDITSAWRVLEFLVAMSFIVGPFFAYLGLSSP